MRPQDLILYAGGECLEKYGVLVKRTSPAQDVPETHVRASTGYFIDRDGILRIAGQNVPRIEWLDLDGDGVRETPVYLGEGQRTNAWTYSEQSDNGAWTKFRASIDPDAVVAPDGFTTADKVVEDGTATSSHRFSRATPTLTDDTVSTISWFMKAAERSELLLTFITKNNKVPSAWYDLAAGTVGTITTDVATPTATITAVGGGWYRCTFSCDALSGATAPNVFFSLGSGSETDSYTGDGSSGLYLWGLQFEVDQPFASSYIPTVASTVTRNADTLSLPLPFPPQEMTVYVKFVERGSLATGARLWQISNAAGSKPRLRVFGTFGDYQVRIDQVSGDQGSTPSATIAIGDLVEYRVVLNPDGTVIAGVSVNGAAEIMGALSGVPVTGLPAAWSGELFWFNSGGTPAADVGFNASLSIKVARGTRTLAEMRAAA